MSARAGIVVTGTEVLSGIIADRNGPWLSQRLRERGLEVAHIMVVGDRPEDVLAALRFMREEGVDVVVTSGGLGPTADDLTAAVVGRFQGLEMVLDETLEVRIGEILAALRRRWPQLDEEAIRRSNRKQAVIPAGSTVLAPVGTAPGLVVEPAQPGDGPTIVVLPGPPRELTAMWQDAVQTEAFRAAVTGATEYRTGVLRLFGIPESEIAASLLAIEAGGLALTGLEITTCLRRGEIEIVTRYEPATAAVYESFAAAIARRHADTLFSRDGSTIDEQLAALLEGTTLATAESCTGGGMAARLTDRAGASAYLRGGLVVYDDTAKVRLAGVDPELIQRRGAVSPEVAEALARGARTELEAEWGVGITGVAGPGGGSVEKPVGRVCLAVAGPGGVGQTVCTDLPGDRAAVRDRSVTVGMHMLRRVLLGARGEDGVLGGVQRARGG